MTNVWTLSADGEYPMRTSMAAMVRGEAFLPSHREGHYPTVASLVKVIDDGDMRSLKKWIAWAERCDLLGMERPGTCEVA